MKTQLKATCGKAISFAAILATTSALGLSGGAASADTIKLMAGQSGGTWNGLAGALKTILESDIDGLTVDIRPGGSAANTKAIGKGIADIAWMLATVTVQAQKGETPFEEPLEICNIAAFHPTVMQYVTADDEIQSIGDVKGKRVATLPKGTGTEALARQMMGFHGIGEDDLGQYNFGSFGDVGTMMKDGHVDIFMGTSGIPAGGIMDMYSSISGLRMLPVTDEDFAKLKEANSAYIRYTLPADTYPNQPDAIQVAAFPTHLGMRCDYDEEAAYQITKSLIGKYKDLGTVVGVISTLDLGDLTADIGVPFHPGAVRAYKEAGAM